MNDQGTNIICNDTPLHKNKVDNFQYTVQPKPHPPLIGFSYNQPVGTHSTLLQEDLMMET